MVEQVDIQNLSEIKSLIEENNASLRAAIQALDALRSQASEIFTNQILQPQQSPPSIRLPLAQRPAEKIAHRGASPSSALYGQLDSDRLLSAEE